MPWNEEFPLRQQQQPSFPFPPGAIMSQNQMMMIPPEQLQYLQEMRRAEQVMMASRAARAAASQGPPQLGGRMSFEEFGAPQNMPARIQWDREAYAPFIPQVCLNPSSLLLAQAHSDVLGMMQSRIIPREDNMDMLHSILLRQQEERIMSIKYPGGRVPPPAKRQRDHAPDEQWDQQNITSHAYRLTRILPKTKPPKACRRHVKTFPVKLMDNLTEYYDETIVAWLPDGKSFVVVDPPDFCDKILSKAFKGAKYASFVRKLNRWGFSRLLSGTGVDCFHHPLFQRNRMDLCIRIVCRDAYSETTINPTVLQDMEKPSLAGIEKHFKHRRSKEILA